MKKRGRGGGGEKGAEGLEGEGGGLDSRVGLGRPGKHSKAVAAIHV